MREAPKLYEIDYGFFIYIYGCTNLNLANPSNIRWQAPKRNQIKAQSFKWTLLENSTCVVGVCDNLHEW